MNDLRNLREVEELIFVLNYIFRKYCTHDIFLRKHKGNKYADWKKNNLITQHNSNNNTA